MNPSRTWTSGSSRCCFATWIIAASSRFNDNESVTRASESRSASIAARSVGDWAVRRRARLTGKARRTNSERRMLQLYPGNENWVHAPGNENGFMRPGTRTGSCVQERERVHASRNENGFMRPGTRTGSCVQERERVHASGNENGFSFLDA